MKLGDVYVDKSGDVMLWLDGIDGVGWDCIQLNTNVRMWNDDPITPKVLFNLVDLVKESS